MDTSELAEMGKKIMDSVAPTWIPRDENGNCIAPPSPTEVDRREIAFGDMDDRIILRILSYINHSDLIQCRLMNRRFLYIISNSKLLISSTTFICSLKPGSETDFSFLDTPIAFESTRVDYLDFEVYMNLKKFDDLSSANYYFRPPLKFLSNLKSLEFQNCYITWETIKRLVNNIPLLERLSLSRCQFVERKKVSLLGEFEEFRVGSTFFNLKAIKINEYNDLQALNRFIEKLLGYSAKSLEEIQIKFDPEDETEDVPTVLIPSSSGNKQPVELRDMEIFCKVFRQLVQLNTPVLRSLTVDLKYQPLLNMFIPQVFGSMEKYWEDLDLDEFTLSPPGCSPAKLPTQLEITENCISSSQVLIGFLESQLNLKKAAIPHFRSVGAGGNVVNGQEKQHRAKIGASIPSSIEYLCVPNQEYVPQDFFKKFPSLKKLYIGGCTGDDELPIALKSRMLDPTKNIATGESTTAIASFSNSLGFDKDMAMSVTTRSYEPWDRLREFGVGSTIINGIELMKIIKKFHFLIKLEVTSHLPVMQDEDLQCVIESMSLLQCLNISACDFLTDFGVTGILRNSCEMMVRLNNYHSVADTILDARYSFGKPLSQLKGLRNLIMMGKSHITDVGIHFGLRFLELQKACLPYNENITEWGIQQFGEKNPSLQVFVMSSINQRSKEGFVHLKTVHPRVRKNKCTYLNYSDDDKPDDFSNSLVKFDIVKNAISDSMGGMCTSFRLGWLFGKGTEEEKVVEEIAQIAALEMEEPEEPEELQAVSDGLL